MSTHTPTRDELVEALREGARDDNDPTALRALADRLCDPKATFIGRDKELAAQVIGDYARFIRLARALLARLEV